jgi:hypothetical protein
MPMLGGTDAEFDHIAHALVKLARDRSQRSVPAGRVVNRESMPMLVRGDERRAAPEQL